MSPRTKKPMASVKAEWLSHIAEQLGEGIAVADLKGRLVFVNQAWAKMHGYSVPELVGRNIHIGHNARQMREDVIPFNRKVMRFGKWSGRVGHIRRDGTPFMTEMTTTILRDYERRPAGIIGFAKDISDRLRAEEAHQTLERVMAMFGQANRAVGRAADEKSLLQEICDIIVRIGGYAMSWAGVSEPENGGKIRPLVSSGAELGYLRAVAIGLKGRLGSGPTGRALRTGRPAVSQNLLIDPRYRPWRQEARKWGYASSAAFPLMHGRERLGVLNVYSGRPGAFGGQELSLLCQLADNLSRGLALLRQQRIDRLFFEALPDFFFRLDASGTILDYRGGSGGKNYASPSELVGRKVSSVLPKNASILIGDALGRILRSRRMESFEYTHKIRDKARHYEARLLPLTEGQAAVLVRDITRHRQAEVELIRSRRQFQTLAGISPVGIFQTRPDGYTTYVNPQWCRIAGITSQQALGNGWLRAVHPDDRKRVGGGWRRAIGGRRPSSTLYRFLHRDGRVRWVIGQALPEKDPQGRTIGYVGTVTDVTEYKAAEDKLRACADFNQAIIASSPIGIAIRDRSGRLVSYNKAWERLWAMPLSMIEEMKQAMTPDLLRRIYWYVPEHLPKIARVFRKGGSYYIPEIHFPKRRPGQAEWINQHFYTIPDARGRVDKIVVMVEDISERKRAEQEALMLSQAVRCSSECINVTDLDNNILFVNQAFCRAYGYKESELLGRNISLVIPPGPDLEAVEDIRRRTLAGGWQGELENLKKDGSRFPVQLSTSVVRDEQGQPRYLIGITRDISERKRAEAALRESEARYRLLVQHAPAGIFEFDYVKGRISDANDVMCQYTGYSREEILAMDPLDLLDDESRDLHLKRLSLAQAGADLPQEAEYRIRCKDGRTIWGHFMSRYVFAGGRPVRATTVVHDVTEARLAAQRLAESEIKYRQIFEGIAEGVYRSTPDGRVLMANPALVRLLGYSSLEELQKVDIGREGYINPTLRDEFKRRIERDGSIADFVSRWRRRDGSELIVSENARAVRDPEGNILYYEGTVEDITERTRSDLALLDEKNKLSRLFDVSLAVAGSGTVQEMMDRTMHGLDELKLFGRMVMVVARGKGGVPWLSFVGLNGEDLDLIRRSPPVPPDQIDGLLDRNHRICNSYYLPDSKQGSRRLLALTRASRPAENADWNAGDCLVVPLVAKQNIIGYLSMMDPADGRMPAIEIVRLLELYANQAATAIVNLSLYDDLEASYYDTLKAFVAAMEAKDPYTKGHSENVQAFSLRLARHLGLSGDRLRAIDYSSLLHDIGKLGVPEDILNKPGSLTEEEYLAVKQHPALGSQMVSGIGSLATSAPIIHAHHEFFDGRGYPEGRRGQDIPLEARIIAVADAYEAMTSDRPYRRAYTSEEALRRLREASASQFDPELVGAFIMMLQSDE